MPFYFEKLEVYQRAVAFSKAVASRVAAFPRGHGYLVEQLARASLSIAADIAEGNGRLAPAERAHFFGIARGSAYECVPMIDLAMSQGCVSPEERATLYKELDEISRMLSALIRGIPGRADAKSSRRTRG